MTLTSITFPIPGGLQTKYLKKIGDVVHTGDVLAEFGQNQEMIEIDIAESLQVPSKNAASLLIKNLGDLVEKDEVIARRSKGFLFKKTLEVKSIFAGKIFELDNFSGKIKIAGRQTQTSFRCPISGHVKEVDHKGMTIEFKGEEIHAKKICGITFFAQLEKVSSRGEEVDGADISIEMKGKILYGGHFSLSDLNKAMAVGVSGIVTGDMTEHELEKFSNEKTFSFVDGADKMSLSIAILDEEGCRKMERVVNGKELYFDVSSCKIIIPHD